MDITNQQRDLLEQLETETENFTYAWDEVRGVLSFARGENLGRNLPPGAASESSPQAALGRFLEKYETLFGSSTLLRTVHLLRQRTDNIGFTHFEYQQVLAPAAGDKNPDRKKAPPEPIEVYGSKLAAHFAPGARLVEVQSSCYLNVTPENQIETTVPSLQKSTLETIAGLPGFKPLQERMKRQGERLFPLMQSPRVVVYPWKGKMIYAWASYGYGVLPKEEQEERLAKEDIIAFGQMFFDAATGALFLFAPTRKGVDNPTTGSGLGCIPLGGPFQNESLQIVRVDASSTYLLKNKTRARDIVTYDANANSAWVYPSIPSFIESGAIPVSSDTDGDSNWNRVAADTTNAQRTASQQPEVDEHFTAAALYDWYAAVGGRVGWDDNQYTAPLVPNQTINVLAHTYDGSWGTSRSVNAFFDQELVSGHWVSHLAFFDGDPTGATSSSFVFDYLAGSRAVVGHEYQHAVTDFSFVDGAGNPGLTYTDWLAAVHEGMSDVFGGLFSQAWWMGTEVSPTGQVFRNLAFPRDSAAADPSKFDHFDDRDNTTGTSARYFRGDILAHSAYLSAQGGVHQRSVRTPVLIPVHSIGMETLGGLDVYKSARIWYRAVTHYLSNIGSTSGLPANAESVFRTIRNACVSAAIDLYGTNSLEHKTTVLAWYAVGLQPVGTPYGPDVTFLTWGADWWMSRPYIGIGSPDWSSRDLFIHNGGTSEWNAQINVMDGGSPTQFENKVYCRVRNVGDQTANNVQVQFEYTKIASGGATWLPMTDKDGNIQTLNLGNLAAGQFNFSDADQDTPPTTAMVKWCIPPLESGETVDHFCMRARVFSINDVNPHNNEVQSNVAYTPYVPGTGFRMGFFVGNDRREAIPVDLVITHTLPRSWKFTLIEPLQGVILKPGETRRVHGIIDMPASPGPNLEAPFDGRIRGTLSGPHAGTCSGNLFGARLSGTHFTAQVAVNAHDGAHISGRFAGSLDLFTAQLEGALTGVVQSRQAKGSRKIEVHLSACLRADRIINIGQYYRKEPLGGLSLQVQVPLPAGRCFEPLPPTATLVTPTRMPGALCLENARDLIHCLDLPGKRVCSVDVRSVVIEVRFKREDCD
jgi:Zn-dependent metalloprotease